MSRPWKSGYSGWVFVTALGLTLPALLLTGCESTGPRGWWNIDNCATIPKGAIPPPYGTYLGEINNGQHQRAEVEKLVVHKNEWYMGGTEPGPDGRRHLAEIGRTLSCLPPNWPIVIEPIEPEELKDRSIEAAIRLNESRRQHVIAYLAERGDPAVDRRVIVGYPTAEGLYGDPAALIGTRYLFSQGGFGGGGGGAGGFGGGGGFGGFGGGAGGMGTGGAGGFF